MSVRIGSKTCVRIACGEALDASKRTIRRDGGKRCSRWNWDGKCGKACGRYDFDFTGNIYLYDFLGMRMFTSSGGGCDKRVIALQDARELTVILRHCGADDFRHIGVPSIRCGEARGLSPSQPPTESQHRCEQQQDIQRQRKLPIILNHNRRRDGDVLHRRWGEKYVIYAGTRGRFVFKSGEPKIGRKL